MTQQQNDFIRAMSTKDTTLMLESLELVKNIDFEIKIKSGKVLSPMHIAARFGHMSVLKALIERGAQVDKQNSDGFTPLHLAQVVNHINCATYLLTIDPELVTKGDTQSVTPLHLACQGNNLHFLKLYLNCGIRIDLNKVRDNKGATPLHWAVRAGNFEAVQYLIERGAKSSVVDHVNQNPRQYCLLPENAELVKFLRSKEILSLFEICAIEVEKLIPESRAPLPQMVESERKEAVEFLQNLEKEKTANLPNVERQAEMLRAEFKKLRL